MDVKNTNNDKLQTIWWRRSSSDIREFVLLDGTVNNNLLLRPRACITYNVLQPSVENYECPNIIVFRTHKYGPLRILTRLYAP